MAVKENELPTIKENLKFYWNLIKKEKLLICFVLILVILLEALLLIDKLLLKKVIDGGTNFLAGSIDKISFIHYLWIIAIVFIIATVIRISFSSINMRVKQKLEADLALKLKKYFFSHILRLSHDFHSSHKSGSLISRLARGTDAVEEIHSFFFDSIVPIGIRLVLVGTTMIYFDVTSMVISVVCMVSFIGISIWMQKFQNKARIIYNDSDDLEKAYTGDAMLNIDSVKYFGKENFIIRRFLNYAEKSKIALLNFNKYYVASRLIQGGILGIGIFLIIYFSINKLIAGEMTIGTLVFIYTTFIGFHSDAVKFAIEFRGFSRAMINFGSLSRYSKIKNEIEDPKTPVNLKVEEGLIEFRNVKFSYHKSMLFNGFSLNIFPGEKVALVGESGAGKSTLIKLLYRLHDVQKGSIKIDKVDIKEIKQDNLRSELSIVPQECVLFDDTIYNNILFSKPEASRKEVLKAIKFAGLKKFIKRLPKGEKTIVGQRGIKLSGGEKQRVSIARALLANKKIVVLDEATSSLDSQTEHQIQRDLKNLLKNKTTIIIAHRLSTIMNADKIVVLDKGKVVQVGTHSNLINKKGKYQNLWKLQKGGYIN